MGNGRAMGHGKNNASQRLEGQAGLGEVQASRALCGLPASRTWCSPSLIPQWLHRPPGSKYSSCDLLKLIFL